MAQFSAMIHNMWTDIFNFLISIIIIVIDPIQLLDM